GFFGVGGTPVRSGPGESALLGRQPTPARIGEAAKAAAAALRPDGDLHAAAEYRWSVAAALASRVLAAALERCGKAAWSGPFASPSTARPARGMWTCARPWLISFAKISISRGRMSGA